MAKKVSNTVKTEKKALEDYTKQVTATVHATAKLKKIVDQTNDSIQNMNTKLDQYNGVIGRKLRNDKQNKTNFKSMNGLIKDLADTINSKIKKGSIDAFKSFEDIIKSVQKTYQSTGTVLIDKSEDIVLKFKDIIKVSQKWISTNKNLEGVTKKTMTSVLKDMGDIFLKTEKSRKSMKDLGDTADSSFGGILGKLKEQGVELDKIPERLEKAKNKWIEWQKITGGKGLTRAQIKKGYSAVGKPPSIPSKPSTAFITQLQSKSISKPPRFPPKMPPPFRSRMFQKPFGPAQRPTFKEEMRAAKANLVPKGTFDVKDQYMDFSADLARDARRGSSFNAVNPRDVSGGRKTFKDRLRGSTIGRAAGRFADTVSIGVAQVGSTRVGKGVSSLVRGGRRGLGGFLGGLGAKKLGGAIGGSGGGRAGKIFGKVGGAAGKAGKLGFKGFGKVMKGLTKGLMGAFGIIFKILGPILAIFEPIGEILGMFGELIGTALLPILTEIITLLFSEETMGMITGIMEAMKPMVEFIVGFIQLLMSSGAIGTIMDVVTTVLGTVFDLFKDPSVKAALNSLVEVFMMLAKTVLPILNPMLKLFSELLIIVSRIFSFVVIPVVKFMAKVITSVFNAIFGILNVVIRAINKIPGIKQISELPSLSAPSLNQQGMIRETGLAKVHKGEAVVRKELVSEIFHDMNVTNNFNGNVDDIQRMEFEGSMERIYNRKRRGS